MSWSHRSFDWSTIGGFRLWSKGKHIMLLPAERLRRWQKAEIIQIFVACFMHDQSVPFLFANKHIYYRIRNCVDWRALCRYCAQSKNLQISIIISQKGTFSGGPFFPFHLMSTSSSAWAIFWPEAFCVRICFSYWFRLEIHWPCQAPCAASDTAGELFDWMCLSLNSHTKHESAVPLWTSYDIELKHKFSHQRSCCCQMLDHTKHLCVAVFLKYFLFSSNIMYAHVIPATWNTMQIHKHVINIIITSYLYNKTSWNENNPMANSHARPPSSPYVSHPHKPTTLLNIVRCICVNAVM